MKRDVVKKLKDELIVTQRDEVFFTLLNCIIKFLIFVFRSRARWLCASQSDDDLFQIREEKGPETIKTNTI
jgi:hypothetical protein